MKILIADDESLARKLLVSYLETEEVFDVVGEAANGLEVVQQYEALKPDLIYWMFKCQS